MLAMSVALVTEATVASASQDTSVAAKKKPKKKPTVKLATTSVGKILVAADGRTLYAFDPDGTNIQASACTGGCATVWAPLVPTGKPKAGKGLKASELVVGVGGQLSYFSHLLYSFSGDAAPGDTTGQGVGGVWHVVDASGNPIL
jgi:predicted lipoprotein with Yx(FWY)xxD motif